MNQRPTPGPKPPADCPNCNKPKSATLYDPREWHHDQKVCSEACGKAWTRSSKRWQMELATCMQAQADLAKREVECRAELAKALEREAGAA